MKNIYLIVFEALHNILGLYLDQCFIFKITPCLYLILSTHPHSAGKE